MSKRDFELRVAPWVKAISDEKLRSAVIHLCITAHGARTHALLPQRRLEALEDATDEVLDAVIAGTLKGVRARRRVEAVEMRYYHAHARCMVTCPTCGTSVFPSRLKKST